ncbi:MAG TPA: helix-turn-helix transcriptional regulator [Candidatus Enterosoma merdigallinarum]|nr:helix-turn-helix transcriptional regulator [Candidatus Enterosoma merdigallinarum]
MEHPVKKIIREKGISNVRIARLLGICDETLYSRLNGKTDFRQRELVKLAEFLNVPVEIFFEEEKR